MAHNFATIPLEGLRLSRPPLRLCGSRRPLFLGDRRLFCALASGSWLIWRSLGRLSGKVYFSLLFYNV
nr:MAG TPA: hypothetical protein [Caudoviricetes sp.]